LYFTCATSKSFIITCTSFCWSLVTNPRLAEAAATRQATPANTSANGLFGYASVDISNAHLACWLVHINGLINWEIA
jgi:hypothetical protein